MREGGRLGLAVVGAHLVGMPLHSELAAHGAVLRDRTTTAPSYRLHLLAGGPPPRPGLVRVASGGVSIEVEVHDLPITEVGRFLLGVPPPLAIGTIELATGEWVHGFVCEPIALHGAVDITAHGGWRAYLADASGASPC